MASLQKLDQRVNAYRPDLADASLRGVVQASAYVEPQLRRCVQGVVPMYAAPDRNAGRVSEIRYGEFLDVLEIRPDGYAWVQNRYDRYVGYIRHEGALTEEIANFTHRTSVLRTFIYAKADLKSTVLDALPLGAFVSPVGEPQNGFYALASGGYVFGRHIAEEGSILYRDYVFTAGRMMGVPYLWGGRSPLGIDCSGLVQLVLELAGIEAPRDSDQQRELYGHPLPMHWRDIDWRRGDLIFFKGHVGIMTDHAHIIHANAHAMQVTVDRLDDVVDRSGPILAAGRGTTGPGAGTG